MGPQAPGLDQDEQCCAQGGELGGAELGGKLPAPDLADDPGVPAGVGVGAAGHAAVQILHGAYSAGDAAAGYAAAGYAAAGYAAAGDVAGVPSECISSPILSWNHWMLAVPQRTAPARSMAPRVGIRALVFHQTWATNSIAATTRPA